MKDKLIKTKTNSFIIVDGKICYIDEYFKLFVCDFDGKGNYYMDGYEKVYLQKWQSEKFDEILSEMYEN